MRGGEQLIYTLLIMGGVFGVFITFAIIGIVKVLKRKKK